MKASHAVFASVAFAVSLVASADIYLWKDRNGRTVYGDHYPPGVDAKVVRSGPVRLATPAPQPDAPAAPHVPATPQTPATPATPVEAARPDAQRKAQCGALRDRLASVDTRLAALTSRDPSARSHGEKQDDSALREERRTLKLKVDIVCQTP